MMLGLVTMGALIPRMELFLMMSLTTSLAVWSVEMVSSALWEFNSEIMLSSHFSPWLTLLTLWAVTGALMKSEMMGGSKDDLKIWFLALLTVALVLAFNSCNLLKFYFFFEVSLLPILMIILGWGYQPERVYASVSMIFYTLIASLPLLIIIIGQLEILSLTMDLFMVSSFLKVSTSLKSWLAMMSISGMLVKLPVYSVHLWLPRAHVEAPTEGSMLLASVMLKLGGYGIIVMLPWLSSAFTFLWSIQLASLMGGVFMALVCLRQNDIKSLIAYSSIAHMAMAMAGLLSASKLGVWAAALAFLSHGVVSSSLFMGAHSVYSSSNSRNMLLLKSGLSVTPLFSLFWFIACLGNMGAPPSLNLVGEIFLLVSLFTSHWGLLLAALPMAGLATAFTLSLYLASQHHQSVSSLKAKQVVGNNIILANIFHSVFILSGVILWLVL